MRYLTAAIAIASGFIVLLGYLYPVDVLVQLRVMLPDWAVVIAAMAVLVGVGNLIVVHMDKIRRREKKRRLAREGLGHESHVCAAAGVTLPP